MFKSLFNLMSLRHQFTFRGRGWVITKKNPANAPEMKKFSKLAKSQKALSAIRVVEFFQTTSFNPPPLQSYRSLQEQQFAGCDF